MHHPKWFVNDKDLKEGDVVLFLKNEKELGQDGKIRSVNVKYINNNEKVNRFTNRATPQLVDIHAVDDIGC